MNKMPQITISDFVEVLRQERTSGGYFVSGLIIQKDNDSPSVGEIVEQLQDNILINISSNADNNLIIKGIKDAFENRKWLVLHLNDGTLPPLWREQLTRLRDSNAVFIQGKTVEDTFFADLPESVRVVAVINNENIKNVNYPEFLNLFGPVIEI